MTKIYTKTGDSGDTSLFTGERVSKADINIAALGDIDECNSALGKALSIFPPTPAFYSIREQLIAVQHALFDIGAAVATPRTRAAASKLEKTRFDADATKALENWIDVHQHALPPLKNFILPGGHPAGAQLHVARTICRRAERNIIPLFQSADINEEVLIYINRLSDYLFVVARRVNHLAGCPEPIWEHHRSHANVQAE